MLAMLQNSNQIPDAVNFKPLLFNVANSIIFTFGVHHGNTCYYILLPINE